MMQVFDDTPCRLGEGALWHPTRNSLFWFDILERRLYEKQASSDEPILRQFDQYVSAAGWIDADTLVIASQSNLFTFDLDTGDQTHLVDLEADNVITRSNDGRADTRGGFWIGTMGINLEPQAGAVYRYYCGELRLLFDKITISNAICFAADGTCAYFTDTPTQQIMRVALDEDGWPTSAPQVHIDLRAEGLLPDGAIIDAAGNLWSAQWGASRLACYGSDGAFMRAVDLPTPQVSCPAFGGTNMDLLFATTASDGLPADKATGAGATYVTALTGITGRAEPRVILGDIR